MVNPPRTFTVTLTDLVDEPLPVGLQTFHRSAACVRQLLARLHALLARLHALRSSQLSHVIKSVKTEQSHKCHAIRVFWRVRDRIFVSSHRIFDLLSLGTI